MVASKMDPYSLYSLLLLFRDYRALVKSSALLKGIDYHLGRKQRLIHPRLILSHILYIVTFFLQRQQRKSR